MLRISLAMLVGALVLVGSGVVASLARAQSGGADPTATISAYEAARNRHDIDGALALFADDATISQRSTTFSGKDEIRKFLEGAANRGRFSVVSERRTNGTQVTWTERSAGQVDRQPPGGGGIAGGPVGFVVAVEAVVQDGKIRSIAYLAGTQVARLDPSLDSRGQLPAPVGLGAVASVLLAALALTSMSLRRSAGAVSTLRGRLLTDLRGWTAARQAP